MPDYRGFIGGSNITQSPIAGGALTVNFYVERNDDASSPFPLQLYPTPGYSSLSSASSSPGRGVLKIVHRGVEHFYAVIGTQFGELSSTAFAFSILGTVASDATPATLSYNGQDGGQVFVTSGNNGYIWDVDAETLTQVRTGATTMGKYLIGYFVALDAATGTVYRSALGDGTSWDPNEFHRRSIASDPWISIEVIDRYLWHFGTETSEVWYPQGVADDPFAPHPSGLVPFGCGAAFSPQVVAGALMWLSQTVEGSGYILRASGFRPQIVSTFATHSALDAAEKTSDAIGDVYEDLGHTFYLLTFPTADRTLCYDATQNMEIPPAMRWTDRGTWIAEDNKFVAQRALFHVFAFGRHFTLDRANGSIYLQSSDIGLDVDVRPLRRVRRPAGLFNGNRRVFVSEFEVVHEAGLGLVSGQGSDPLMMLRVSTNGGKVWGPERQRSAGELGDYTARLRWARCGSGPHWVPEVVVTDPVPWRLLGAQYRGTPIRAEAA